MGSDDDSVQRQDSKKPAKRDYSRFKFVLLADKITVIGNKISVYSNFHPLEVVDRGSETQL